MDVLAASSSLTAAEVDMLVIAYSFGCRVAMALAGRLLVCTHAHKLRPRLVLIDGPTGGPLGTLEAALHRGFGPGTTLATVAEGRGELWAADAELWAAARMLSSKLLSLAHLFANDVTC